MTKIEELEERIKKLEQKQVFENHYHYYPPPNYHPNYYPGWPYYPTSAGAGGVTSAMPSVTINAS